MPSFTDSGLSPATAYTYKISAYDAAGNESARGTGLKVTTAAAAGTNVLGAGHHVELHRHPVDLGATWKDRVRGGRAALALGRTAVRLRRRR